MIIGFLVLKVKKRLQKTTIYGLNGRQKAPKADRAVAAMRRRKRFLLGFASYPETPQVLHPMGQQQQNRAIPQPSKDLPDLQK